MNFEVRFAPDAQADLDRLYDFLLEQCAGDWVVGDRALDAIANGLRLLEQSPFSCRKARPQSPLLRELVISFGGAGYVALFEIDSADSVTVLAIRHQREDDYL